MLYGVNFALNVNIVKLCLPPETYHQPIKTQKWHGVTFSLNCAINKHVLNEQFSIKFLIESISCEKKILININIVLCK